MKKAIVKNFTHGLLKDGRSFEIIELKKLCICEDGSIHCGTVKLNVDGKTEIYPISAFAENIDYDSLPLDTLC